MLLFRSHQRREKGIRPSSALFLCFFCYCNKRKNLMLAELARGILPFDRHLAG